MIRTLALLLAATMAATAEAQSTCRTAFADSVSVRELRAFDRVAAVPPVWDGYRLARHPLLLLADSTHHGGPVTPVCAAIWKAGARLRIVELAARPAFSTALYGMIDLDPVGPHARNATELAAAFHQPTPVVASALRAQGVRRAIVLNVPLDFGPLGALGRMLTTMKADPALLHADLAVHESFHLHTQFPAWLDQHRTYAWPAWDVQPDRRQLRERCYAGTTELSAALESEIGTLLAAFDALYADSASPDPVLALAHARRFVDARAARRRLQDTMSVARGATRISCALAEDLMELEEGTTQWIGHATTVRAGLTTLARQRGSYAGKQPDAYYRTGPLQLWILEGLLGRDAMRRVTASIARSAGPDGGVFGQFAQRTLVLADARK